MHICCWSLPLCGLLSWQPEQTNTKLIQQLEHECAKMCLVRRFKWHISSIHYTHLQIRKLTGEVAEIAQGHTTHKQQRPDLNLSLTLQLISLISTPYPHSWWEAAFLRSSRHHQLTWASVSVFYPSLPPPYPRQASWVLPGETGAAQHWQRLHLSAFSRHSLTQ